MASKNVPAEMLAAQVVEKGKPYVIHKVPTPTKLGEYQMLIKTAVASLCHTDFMVIDGTFGNPLPCTGSHEGTGVVVDVGAKVLESKSFKVGDRVMSGLALSQCGTCQHCRGPDDWHQYCFNHDGALGINRDGAFAEYHVVDARVTSHLPDNIDFQTAAPLACAGVTIYRAIKVSGVKEGGWLAIVGAGGGLGHFGIQFAIKVMGLNLIAVDARDQGIEVCRQSQAKHIFDARDGQEKVVESVQALTDGLGVEATINVSDHPTSAALSCAITRPHGTVVQTAQPKQVCIPFQEFVLRDITVKGTMFAGVQVSQEMLEAASKHGIRAEVTPFYGLEEIPKMMEFSHSGKLKGKAVCVVDSALK